MSWRHSVTVKQTGNRAHAAHRIKPQNGSEIESWPLARRFEIARGSKISAELVRDTLSENGFCGRGEAVPYRRYGESIETVSAAIETLQPQIEAGMTRAQLGEAILL